MGMGSRSNSAQSRRPHHDATHDLLRQRCPVVIQRSVEAGRENGLCFLVCKVGPLPPATQRWGRGNETGSCVKALSPHPGPSASSSEAGSMSA